MLFPERQYEPLIRCGGLKLKIKIHAKSFSQSQAPGPIHPSSKWRMDDELQASSFIKEPFGNDGVLRWDSPQGAMPRRDVCEGLFGSSLVQAAFRLEPFKCRGRT